MVIHFVVGIGLVYCDVVALVTSVGSLFPLPKGNPFANRQGKGKKKAIAFKSKQDNMGSKLVKRNEPEDLSHRKKQKAKKAKMTSKRVSSGVGGSSTCGASSAIAIQVFDHVYCVLFLC